MDISPLIPKGWQLITGYGSSGFKINNEWVDGSLLVFPDRTEQWNVKAAGDITLDSLSTLLSSGIELLLLGTGGTMAVIDPAIRTALKAANIALEAMDTGAACRTYNILLSEERRVAAALVAI